MAAVEQQVGCNELKSESFTPRTLARVCSLKSCLVEWLFARSMCSAETSGCEWGLGEWVGSGPSMAHLEPCHTPGCQWASVNLTAASGSFFRASFPVCREEKSIERGLRATVASRRHALVLSCLYATKRKHCSSSPGASPLLPVCSSKFRNRRIIYASRPCR